MLVLDLCKQRELRNYVLWFINGAKILLWLTSPVARSGYVTHLYISTATWYFMFGHEFIGYCVTVCVWPCVREGWREGAVLLERERGS